MRALAHPANCACARYQPTSLPAYQPTSLPAYQPTSLPALPAYQRYQRSMPSKTLTRRPKTAKTLGRKRSQLCTSISTTTHVLSGRAWALSVRVNLAPRLCSLQESEIMLFAGVRARALSGSTPDYPDVEHETLCVRVCVSFCSCMAIPKGQC